MCHSTFVIATPTAHIITCDVIVHVNCSTTELASCSNGAHSTDLLTGKCRSKDTYQLMVSMACWVQKIMYASIVPYHQNRCGLLQRDFSPALKSLKALWES